MFARAREVEEPRALGFAVACCLASAITSSFAFPVAASSPRLRVDRLSFRARAKPSTPPKAADGMRPAPSARGSPASTRSTRVSSVAAGRDSHPSAARRPPGPPRPARPLQRGSRTTRRKMQVNQAFARWKQLLSRESRSLDRSCLLCRLTDKRDADWPRC